MSIETPKLSSESQEYRDNLAKIIKDARKEDEKVRKQDENSGIFKKAVKKIFKKDDRITAPEILAKRKLEEKDKYEAANKEQKEVREDFLIIRSWEKLVEKMGIPSKEDLYYIIENVSLLREEAGIKLLEQDQSIDTYKFIMEKIPSMRRKLFKEMREKYPVPEGERVYEFSKISDEPDNVFNDNIKKEPNFRNRDGIDQSLASYFKGKYGHNDCDVEIGLYDYGRYERKNDGSIVPLEGRLWRGMYITRIDGTFNDLGYDNSLMTGINSVKIIDNKVFAELQFSNGKTEIRDVGREKVSPIYRVYRDNESYKSFFGESSDSTLRVFDSLKQVYNLEKDFIIEKGEDIVESDDIKSIPDDAIIITDQAALEALPSIRSKKLIRIDEVFRANEFDSLKFDYYLKKINNNPKAINILKENISSHVEKEFLDNVGSDYSFDSHSDSGTMEYVEYIKKEVLKVFKDVDIKIINSIQELEKEKNEDCINIIDRHARNDMYNDPNTLKLPLYGNEKEMSNEFAKTRLKDLENRIDEIETI